ncbi:MAG: glycosyltransferase family 2 protein [Thermoplasmata archaeon]
MQGENVEAKARPPQISVLIPAHNEECTIKVCAQKTVAVLSRNGLEFEVVIVDDASTDATLARAREIASTQENVRIVSRDSKGGKGAALVTGFREAKGKVVALLDADLEYAPEELPALIEPIIDGECDIVLGSRFLAKGNSFRFLHRLGNFVLTLATNILFDGKLTDVMTGHKSMARRSLEGIQISQMDFRFEVEFTANALRRGMVIKEIPITYHPRRHGQSKIDWRDGIRCILYLFKLRRMTKDVTGTALHENTAAT